MTTKTILLRDMTVCSSLLFAVFRSKSKYALSHSLGNVSECSDMSKGIPLFHSDTIWYMAQTKY